MRVALLLAATVLAGCVTAPAPVAVDPAALGRGVFSATSVFPGVYDTAGPYARPLVPGAFAILEPEVVNLRSDVDGTNIQMGIVRPDVPPGTRVPVIVDASPYYDAMTVANIRENPHNDRVTFFDFDHYEYYAEAFVPHGYAVVFLATRGTADSGGCWTMFGPEEGADLDQAITWLGTQAWSNGNVGMVGISWEGTTPWMVAAKGNPHLKTVVPVAGATDLYTHVVRGGSPASGLAFFPMFYPYGFGNENNPTNGRSAPHTAEGAVCLEAWEGIAAVTSSSFLASRGPTGFWAERNFRHGAEANYRGSVFVVTGPADYLLPMSQSYPWVAQLEERGVVVKHLIGQWWHNLPDHSVFPPEPAFEKRWDWAEMLLHWFDRWLKDDKTVDIGPRAQVQDTSGAWRDESRGWPPPDARPIPFHLAPGGRLVTEAVAPGEPVLVAPDPNDDGASTFAFFLARNGAHVAQARDPRPPLPCAACPRFDAGPFEREFRFAGVPQLDLDVLPTGPGGHLAAFLYVDEQRVGRGQIDLRVAGGSEEPQPVVPGQRLAMRLLFEPLDVVAPAGSKLTLLLTQGAIENSLPSMPTYPVQVEVGDASTLTLMAFERGPQAFFQPPGASP